MALVPPKTAPCWKRILTDPSCPEFSVLATKLTVGRLRRDVKQQPTTLDRAIGELCDFFTSNEFARRDLNLI